MPAKDKYCSPTENAEESAFSECPPHAPRLIGAFECTTTIIEKAGNCDTVDVTRVKYAGGPF